MNLTHSPLAYHSYPDAAKPRAIVTSRPGLRRGATKVTLILGGFTAMGYLMALSFFRLG